MKNPEIIFTVGLPYSGKSTYTNLFLEMNPDYVSISSDGYIEDIAKKTNTTYNEIFKNCVDDATKWFFDTLKMNLKLNKNIIIDRTNLNKKSRRKILSLVPKNYTKTAFLFNISDEERNVRRNIRNKNISENIINDMKKSYQQPSYDEGFKEIVTING